MINHHDFGSDRYYGTELDNLESITERISERGARNVSRLIETSLRRANEESGTYTSKQLQVLTGLLDPGYVREISNRGYTVLMAEKSVLISSETLINARSTEGIEMLSQLATPIALGMLVNDVHVGWELKTLYVDPDKQGKGIGSKILGMLEEKARSIGVEKLYGEAALFPATQQLYERRGYELKNNVSYDVDGQDLAFRVTEKRL